MAETKGGDSPPGRLARRAFVVAWMALGLAGALNHTIALALFDRRFDLVLPHLAYGHVMFNKNPRTAVVHEYARDDGTRRPLAELVATPALGYASARLTMNVIMKPDYLREVCMRAFRASKEAFTVYVDEYDMDVDATRPARSSSRRCDAHGLAAN